MTATKESHALRAYVLLAAVMLFWAGNAIVGRAVRDDIPPFTLALVRWAGALLILIPFVYPLLREDAPALLRHWKQTLMLGLLGVAGFNGFLYLGLHQTTATNGILIQAGIPPLILILNFLLFRERARWMQAFGLTLSTIGVIVVVVHADLDALIHMQFGRGDVLILCAVVVWSLYASLLRLRPPVHPLSFLAATFVVGALAMLPLAIGEWEEGLRIVWRPMTFAAFAYVATLPSLVAYHFFNQAVAMIGAGRAGQMINLMPLFGSLLAAFVLGEPLHAFHFAGMALILVGIALASVVRPT